MLHEFMHAIQDWIAPGAFVGSSSSQSRAMARGLRRLLGVLVELRRDAAHPAAIRPASPIGTRAAAATTLAELRLSGRRRLPAPRRQREDDGRFHRRERSRDRSTRTARSGRRRCARFSTRSCSATASRQGAASPTRWCIESMFGAPSNPTFALMARKLLDADRALNGGAHGATICSAFTRAADSRRIRCDRAPRGDVTLSSRRSMALPIPDNAPARRHVDADDQRQPRSIERLVGQRQHRSSVARRSADHAHRAGRHDGRSCRTRRPIARRSRR